MKSDTKPIVRLAFDPMRNETKKHVAGRDSNLFFQKENTNKFIQIYTVGHSIPRKQMTKTKSFEFGQKSSKSFYHFMYKKY